MYIFENGISFANTELKIVCRRENVSSSVFPGICKRGKGFCGFLSRQSNNVCTGITSEKLHCTYYYVYIPIPEISKEQILQLRRQQQHFVEIWKLSAVFKTSNLMKFQCFIVVSTLLFSTYAKIYLIEKSAVLSLQANVINYVSYICIMYDTCIVTKADFKRTEIKNKNNFLEKFN